MWVERSRMVDGHDGCDGPDGVNGFDGVDGVDAVDGVDGVDGSDGVVGSVGHQIERTGVDDVLGYDYHGKWLCFLTTSAPKVNFGSDQKFETGGQI